MIDYRKLFVCKTTRKQQYHKALGFPFRAFGLGTKVVKSCLSAKIKRPKNKHFCYFSEKFGKEFFFPEISKIANKKAKPFYKEDFAFSLKQHLLSWRFIWSF